MLQQHQFIGLLLAIQLFVLSAGAGAAAEAVALPQGFVYLDSVIPDIRLDMRYFTNHNFVGERIDGYLAPRAILSRKAAAALAKVQEDLRPFGLGLLVFDAYRPQRAVDHFVRWAQDLQDTGTKAEFYPDVDKRDLFREEYIARALQPQPRQHRRSHPRGAGCAAR